MQPWLSETDLMVWRLHKQKVSVAVIYKYLQYTYNTLQL